MNNIIKYFLMAFISWALIACGGSSEGSPGGEDNASIIDGNDVEEEYEYRRDISVVLTLYDVAKGSRDDADFSKYYLEGPVICYDSSTRMIYTLLLQYYISFHKF